jgi:alpha-N-acetylglucosamine transferase
MRCMSVRQVRLINHLQLILLRCLIVFILVVKIQYYALRISIGIDDKDKRGSDNRSYSFFSYLS